MDVLSYAIGFEGGYQEGVQVGGGITPEERVYWNSKQDELVSGVSIKTINGQDILGEGNIAVQGGGGSSIKVGDVSGFTVELDGINALLKWTDPNDLVLDGVALATWKGTKILRKVGGFPQNENDGVLVVDSGVRNQYSTNGFVDSVGLLNKTTYYYMAIPYTTDYAYNVSEDNGFIYTHSLPAIYGVSIDLTNSNPETSVTYTDEAIGMTGGSPDWNNVRIYSDIKPCVLKNGVVQYYLNPNDFTKKEDGSAADITSGVDGDVMIEIPKMGYRIETIDNTLTVKVTDDLTASGFSYNAFTRSTEGDKNKLYIGAYLGSNLSNNLRSLSGKTPYAGGTAPTGTIATCRTMAQANGAGYDMVSFYPLTLLQCLYLIRYKNLNSQTALGRGYVDNNSSATKTGGTNTKGMYYGETTGKLQMKFAGIEDFWGNLRWWIDGLYCDASRNILTAFNGFNNTGSGYTNQGQGALSNISGFMSKPQGTTQSGFIVKEAGGSATTYFCDDVGLVASRLPIFGGTWAYASSAGAFYFHINCTASNSFDFLGARLMFL